MDLCWYFVEMSTRFPLDFNFSCNFKWISNKFLLVIHWNFTGFPMDFNLYFIEISYCIPLEFQLDFQCISMGIALKFQMFFHWNINWIPYGLALVSNKDFNLYFIKISIGISLKFYWTSTGFPMDSDWYIIEISTVFPIDFHWHFIQNSASFPIDFYKYFIEMSNWN